MLKRLQFSRMERPVSTVKFLRDSGRLDLNPKYQRGDVWGPARRRNLIRSLLVGVPVPPLIVNDRQKSKWDGDEAIAVIDGKQRMTTILMFFDGELSVPGHWFGSQHGSVSYPDLTAAQQHRFSTKRILFAEGTLPNIESEIEVFELVNFGGVPQGESD